MKGNFDKIAVTVILFVFLALLVAFHRSGFAVTFLEQSANLALGCLLGLVKGEKS